MPVIGNENAIWLLGCVLAGLILTGLAALGRRRAIARFATTEMRSKIIAAGSAVRRWTAAGLIAATLACLAVALMDIRWGKMMREVPQSGIEVMFVLDVSRSMLADDVSPSRLDRAKQQIKDIIDEMAGDRVGLVVFAGQARQQVPLTNHYEDFKQTLDSVGPHTVPVGGSRLGDAIDLAARGFLAKTHDHQAIVVITDGEDQESQPVEVARRVRADQGVRIYCVGLGDDSRGAKVPDRDRRGGFVTHQGQTVWSRMNGEILSQIARETEGAYIPVGTKQVDMADVYRRYISRVEQAEFEMAQISATIPRYQWFAAPALIFLLLEVLLTTNARAQTARGKPPGSGNSSIHQNRNQNPVGVDLQQNLRGRRPALRPARHLNESTNSL